MAYTTINKGTDYFKNKKYAGNSGTQSITGIGFQPDWVWIKKIDGTDDHVLYDAVRGATKSLHSNTNEAEDTQSDGLTAFDSDGFSLGADGKSNQGHDYMSWSWKAGNSSGATNNDGSVTTTVTANTTAGFSIVKYTNPGSGSPFTAGHGLGAKPKFIMFKQYSSTANWSVWHTGIGFSKYLVLNNNSAQATANLVTATATDTFSSYYDHHTSGQTIIAYCFAEKAGYSKFGTFKGNADVDGPFVYTGFKPSWVMIKRFDSGSEDWRISDNARDPENVMDRVLFANLTNAESDADVLDFCSNGFKLRTTDGGMNGNNGDYVFMAFAQAPLVGTNNQPAVAR